MVENWQTNNVGKYIELLKKNLDNSQRCNPIQLLQEYRKILLSDNRIFPKTKEQEELLTLGLIVREENRLKITNLIYLKVFNLDYVERQIAKLQKIIDLQETNKVDNTSNLVINNLKNNNVAKNKNLLSIYFDKANNYQNHIKTKIKNQINSKNHKNMKKIKSLIILTGIIIFLPIFLIIINDFLVKNKIKQLDFSQKLAIHNLRKFCNNINFSNSNLNLIFQLEQKKKEFSKHNPNNLYVFPNVCETALNELRVLTAPELAKEGKTIEAIRILCNVPADSEFLIEATVWLDHWYRSSNWGKETKLYLKEVSDCPPREKLRVSNDK
ncbi:hypothetical protein H1P_3430002 [Hyella patelloides LEGE 07179]|uniref:Uncharacterized protein n=1 Tax=Hyella patelloides LEGE 07179 TaxID=945734 RepID=A0A563VVV0_9CYAN|nr:hypothetical protein [Hyella patelloides]VEP15531.1 hypothetical protein H1P_3430002 [Hyella patelloides LEGE 07179]